MPGFKLISEVKTLTSSGVAYPISTRYLPPGTELKPAAGNSGTVYIGGAGVTTSDGYPISASLPYRIPGVPSNGHYQEFYGPSVYAIGSQGGDKLIILIPARDETAV